MYIPLKIDPDGVPCYSSTDIDDYGFPENYGVNMYRIIESREANLQSDYKQEHEYDLRPIHRYSRLARFKSTLYQLIGERGQVPSSVITMVRTYLNPNSPDKWNDTRAILKHYKQNYYNRIPTILETLGYGKTIPPVSGRKLVEITQDFMRISDKFERTKHEYKLRYFPNIRYICFRLLQAHGFEPSIIIPFIRTERKRKSLDILWTLLNKNS